MRAFQDKIRSSRILETLKLEVKQYIAVTAHRKENVDDPVSFQAILNGLGLIYERFKKEVIYPMHPRTKSKLKDMTVPKGIRVIEPLGFYDFNFLSLNAFCLVADSGTTSEEGLFYKVPCVSLRQSTERPETVEAGAHVVAGINPNNIVDSVETVVNMKWDARYDLCDDYSPSSVVINVLRSHITNYF
jgi:UDP-N-acetylglucosamine 2-epimerase (non-hydrolysing)